MQKNTMEKINIAGLDIPVKNKSFLNKDRKEFLLFTKLDINQIDEGHFVPVHYHNPFSFLLLLQNPQAFQDTCLSHSF